jgi:NADH dehydrogenase (ubiquinone) Fe-S protein 4
MSSLRTTASAARLLRTASHARTAAVLPATRRYESSKVPAKTEQEKKETSPLATLPRNAPDYNVPIDMATSYEPLPP